jgi:hypothetical protein
MFSFAIELSCSSVAETFYRISRIEALGIPRHDCDLAVRAVGIALPIR